MAYVPLWISICVTIVCAINVRKTLLKILRMKNEYSSQPSSIVPASDKKLVRFFFRIMLGPLLFCLIHIPGSIRRASEASGTTFSQDFSNFLLVAQSSLDPSHGFINFILYVFLDVDLCKSWKELFIQTQKYVVESITTSRISNTNVVVPESKFLEISASVSAEDTDNPLQTGNHLSI